MAVAYRKKLSDTKVLNGILVGQNPVNWVDPWGLEYGLWDVLGKDERNFAVCEECLSSCINGEYGVSYDVAGSFNPLTPLSILLGEWAEMRSIELKRQGTYNSLKNSKIDYEIGKRQLRTYNQFKFFNEGLSIIGAGAFGYQLGANIYCSQICQGK